MNNSRQRCTWYGIIYVVYNFKKYSDIFYHFSFKKKNYSIHEEPYDGKLSRTVLK
jgi:hypothetical protein